MATLTEGTKSINFSYNTEEQRGRAQYYTGPTLTRTRYYAENYERTMTPAGTQQISYVMAEGKPVAMFVTNGLTGPSDIKYIGTDHLGSITEILNYIRQNPVRAGIVEKEEEYRYSSACDFYGRKGLLELSYYV